MERLRFLWLSVTNRCNEECLHCCVSAGPNPRDPDVLTESNWTLALQDAAELGCRKVQFIGGEPTLVPYLPRLLTHARTLGFDERIGVTTNAYSVSQELVDALAVNEVSVGVSIYSRYPDEHDAVTLRKGSHERTMTNVRRLLSAGVHVQALIPCLSVNRRSVTATVAWLEQLGIKDALPGELLALGRGADLLRAECGQAAIDDQNSLASLCGNCWSGRMAVHADGIVSPCMGSKPWSTSSIVGSRLRDIWTNEQFNALRRRIYSEVYLAKKPQDRDDCNGCATQGVYNHCMRASETEPHLSLEALALV